ncbi:hypothetical protein Pcinc_005445 [Petrolisthes cinctipes]|uniref:Uncharacterized protein n=1 Tax=Petrolisthes cinctipes TaxID=88211 RepID=A0AAE1GF62_PETCI|nr:hypothetical protein Pcinc_005445 [Petrolisthes cinctipes]
MLPSKTKDNSREPTCISMRTCALVPWRFTVDNWMICMLQVFFNYRTLVVRELGGGTGRDEGWCQYLGHHSSTSTSSTHHPSRTPHISPPPSHLTPPSAHTTPLPAHLTPTTAPFHLPPTTPPQLSQRTPCSPLTLPVVWEVLLVVTRNTHVMWSSKTKPT